MKWRNFDGYFRPRQSEVKIYEHLGIRRFRAHMLRLVGPENAERMGWHPLRQGKSNLKTVLSDYREQTQRNETAHLLVLVALVAMSARLFGNGQHAEAMVVLLINIPFNLYPVMLQRHVRHRLNRVLASCPR